MHEISIIENLLELAEAAAIKQQATRIHHVRVRVGVMTGVVPEALTFAFETLREGTLAAEATLSIESVPGCGWCELCQKSFEMQELLGQCPRCGVPSSKVQGGKELELASMEVS